MEHMVHHKCKLGPKSPRHIESYQGLLSLMQPTQFKKVIIDDKNFLYDPKTYFMHVKFTGYGEMK